MFHYEFLFFLYNLIYKFLMLLLQGKEFLLMILFLLIFKRLLQGYIVGLYTSLMRDLILVELVILQEIQLVLVGLVLILILKLGLGIKVLIKLILAKLVLAVWISLILIELYLIELMSKLVLGILFLFTLMLHCLTVLV